MTSPAPWGFSDRDYGEAVLAKCMLEHHVCGLRIELDRAKQEKFDLKMARASVLLQAYAWASGAPARQLADEIRAMR